MSAIDSLWELHCPECRSRQLATIERTKTYARLRCKGCGHAWFEEPAASSATRPGNYFARDE